MTRLLAIMGSGETSPTMSKVHRGLFARLGPDPGPAVLLDTPFGFQENADDIAAKATAYFRESVNRTVSVLSFRRASEVGSLGHETAMTRLREADWVFAGPGSPSYALRTWRASQVPDLLAGKLRAGGCLVFASAAAASLGRLAVPVYEIYKVGEDPHWLEGLDLLAPLGLPAVVVPHFNNAEGGHHDTRYCYLGERRLSLLEGQLPEGTFVLGVDEHTACILDLEAGSATVAGIGGVTARRLDRSVRFETGETVGFESLDVGGARGGARGGGRGGGSPGVVAPGPQPAGPQSISPLLVELGRAEQAFASALAGRNAGAAMAAVLGLDDLLVDWSRDTLESDDLDRARAALRSMVVRLGEAAAGGVRDPRSVVGPFVESLLEARARARSEGRWAEADSIRDALAAAGVDVRDTEAGPIWELR